VDSGVRTPRRERPGKRERRRRRKGDKEAVWGREIGGERNNSEEKRR